MTQEDIVVKYYYRKLLFNMKIEKEIEEIILNENNLEVKDKNKTKIQVDYKDINDIKLEVSYKIKVTNTEELEGKAILEEIIPKGFEMLLEKTNGNWEYNDGKYLLETESLKPGESQEYKVTLRWLPQATNEGEKVNIANIILTKNAPNYKEITENDNKDVAIIEILLNKIPNDEKVESKGIFKKSNTPNTGDSIIVYLIILNSISICIIYILIKRKK